MYTNLWHFSLFIIMFKYRKSLVLHYCATSSVPSYLDADPIIESRLIVVRSKCLVWIEVMKKHNTNALWMSQIICIILRPNMNTCVARAMRLTSDNLLSVGWSFSADRCTSYATQSPVPPSRDRLGRRVDPVALLAPRNGCWR